ncbi:carbohydrate ABC transporter permease [Streptacidiphilus sp. N1-12]|uniref:Carbohydrate ABC transporter permease n=2 Tax=Streptacidiphilus alkalitolerans TaxID=3342712 RepID=A0ABV6VK30_9ACTN
MWLLLAFMVVFFILPVLWLLLALTKTDQQLVHGSPLSFGSLGNVGTAWSNLIDFQGAAILVWLKNSAIYSLGALVLTMVTTIPAGYALAMTRFRGRRLLLRLTLVVMLVPASTLVLPIYLELSAVHLTGTLWSIILPFSFYPFGVYLTFIYYSTSLPRDLLAAARIDGCTEWQIFTRIALPLARPVIGLVGFFSFVGNWNNYFLPLVMLAKSQSYPLQLGLQELLSSTPAFNPAQGGAALNIQRPELALAIVISILPVLLIFLFSQRTLVSGLLAGSTKE